MNREKYVNDKSYREGYIDGRKEGANALVVTALKPYLEKIKKDISGLEGECIELEKEMES